MVEQCGDDIMDATMTLAGTAIGCCLAIPTAIVMYMLMGKLHEWWADRIGLGWL